MFIRFDYLKKDYLMKRFASWLGADFLLDFSRFISDHDVPMGEELLIQWHGVQVTAVLFEGNDLLLLKIQQKKGDTPLHSLVVGETTFYPADKKLESIPQKRG